MLEEISRKHYVEELFPPIVYIFKFNLEKVLWERLRCWIMYNVKTSFHDRQWRASLCLEDHFGLGWLSFLDADWNRGILMTSIDNAVLYGWAPLKCVVRMREKINAKKKPDAAYWFTSRCFSVYNSPLMPTCVIRSKVTCANSSPTIICGFVPSNTCLALAKM